MRKQVIQYKTRNYRAGHNKFSQKKHLNKMFKVEVKETEDLTEDSKRYRIRIIEGVIELLCLTIIISFIVFA